MNLILFTSEETAAPLARTDLRAAHILNVLRRKIGDTFDVGLIDGPRGKGTLDAIGEQELRLTFAWEQTPPPLEPLILILGLPRPQTARDILREATSLGATAIHFVATARSDPNYATSSLWSSGEWRRHCLLGAEQAFDTRLPKVTWNQTLTEALASAAAPAELKIALDNYEGAGPLGSFPGLENKPTPSLSLAFGPERGWADADRTQLRKAGFALAHLGSRVLRSETALIAALAIVRDRQGRS